MKNCIFCKIISGEIPSLKIYEDDFVYVFADISPNNLGHSLVIPKKHHKNLYDIPDKTLSHIMPVVKKLSIAIKKATKADGINIIMNNEPCAGQVVFHSHIHIIPRLKDDGYKHWKSPDFNEVDIEKSVENIKEVLLNDTDTNLRAV